MCKRGHRKDKRDKNNSSGPDCSDLSELYTAALYVCLTAEQNILLNVHDWCCCILHQCVNVCIVKSFQSTQKCNGSVKDA